MDNRSELEELKKMWFSSLRQLENLTQAITKNDTLEESEHIEMRDKVKELYTFLQFTFEMNKFIKMEKTEQFNTIKNVCDSIVKTGE